MRCCGRGTARRALGCGRLRDRTGDDRSGDARHRAEYIRKVEKVGNELYNVEFGKFPDQKDPGEAGRLKERRQMRRRERGRCYIPSCSPAAVTPISRETRIGMPARCISATRCWARLSAAVIPARSRTYSAPDAMM